MDLNFSNTEDFVFCCWQEHSLDRIVDGISAMIRHFDTWYMWSRTTECSNTIKERSVILFSSLLLILLIDLISPKMLEENFERQSGKILSEVFTASGMNLTSDCILSLVQSSMLELKHLILRRAFLEIGNRSHHRNSFTHMGTGIWCSVLAITCYGTWEVSHSSLLLGSTIRFRINACLPVNRNFVAMICQEERTIL